MLQEKLERPFVKICWGKNYVVKFEKYDSIEKMKEDVEFKTIECGYVFEDALKKDIKRGFDKVYRLYNI